MNEEELDRRLSIFNILLGRMNYEEGLSTKEIMNTMKLAVNLERAIHEPAGYDLSEDK